MQLGRIDGWPCGVKLLLRWQSGDFLVAGQLAVDVAANLSPVSAAHRIEAALIVGLNSYLVWKYLIGALLALHLLNSYIYFGKHPFWKYVNAEARTLLLPLRAVPLQWAGGFRAGCGSGAGVSGGRTGWARTLFSLRTAAVLKFHSAIRLLPWGIWPR